MSSNSPMRWPTARVVACLSRNEPWTCSSRTGSLHRPGGRRTRNVDSPSWVISSFTCRRSLVSRQRRHIPLAIRRSSSRVVAPESASNASNTSLGVSNVAVAQEHQGMPLRQRYPVLAQLAVDFVGNGLNGLPHQSRCSKLGDGVAALYIQRLFASRRCSIVSTSASSGRGREALAHEPIVGAVTPGDYRAERHQRERAPAVAGIASRSASVRTAPRRLRRSAPGRWQAMFEQREFSC
jgi:hypothetical protein